MIYGKEVFMKVNGKTVRVFKIKNRKGYAAICAGCLTEGATEKQAISRMLKALKRTESKRAPKK